MQKSDIQSILNRFEPQFDPVHISRNRMDVKVIGYGEISCVLTLSDLPELAIKRMPLFSSPEEAAEYEKIYHQYCGLLNQAGLHVPHSDTVVVERPDGLVVLFICQKLFNSEDFAHTRVRKMSPDEAAKLFDAIVSEVENVWRFSQDRSPELQIALDSQLSNWVAEGFPGDGKIHYIDTSTPLFRVDGREQLNPELFLKSAAPGLRWVIKKFFLSDVVNRYYEFRSVMMDLAANLYKEQCPELIPLLIRRVNESPLIEDQPLSEGEVKSYYNEDKRIWQIVQFSRRVHRSIVMGIFRRPYEFTLPPKIKR